MNTTIIYSENFKRDLFKIVQRILIEHIDSLTLSLPFDNLEASLTESEKSILSISLKEIGIESDGQVFVSKK